MSKKKRRERPDPASFGLPATGAESHAHLDLPEFEGDLPEVLARAKAAGVATFGNVFLGPDAYHANAARFADHPEVFFLCGVHPNDTAKATGDTLAALAGLLRTEPRLKALGEIGLDYYWPEPPHDIQLRIFRAQLELARQLDLRVVIHSREAHADCLKALLDLGFSGRPVLWHCFAGDADLARTVAAHGWHLSIPGSVTYPKSERLAEAVAATDLSRLLIETDCPFLTPEPYRGKRNEPAFLPFTAAKIADILGLPLETVWTATGHNARNFFGV